MRRKQSREAIVKSGIVAVAVFAIGWPCLAQELKQVPVGCDKFKWPLDKERATLTGTDLAQNGFRRADHLADPMGDDLDAAAVCRRQTPRGAGTRAAIANLLCRLPADRRAGKGRHLQDHAVVRRLDRCRAGRPRREIVGVQRRDRLRGRSQEREVRSCSAAADDRTQRRAGRLDRDRGQPANSP